VLLSSQSSRPSRRSRRRSRRVFPLTVFVTTSLERHAVLVDLLAELPTEAWPMFAVGLVGDAARLLTGGQT
jgi:hypothetical protein